MNTKSYINYFSEIASLDDEEQLEILERARYCAFTDLKLNGKSAAYFILSIALGFLVPVASFVLLGFSIIHNALAAGVGVVLSLLVYKKLYATILKKGLDKVLMENGT
jgi:hypothetical protein